METAAPVLIGLTSGFLLAVLLLYTFLKNSFEAQFQERMRESNEQAADMAVKRSRATVKGQVGERFAPFVPGFGYEPADARFLGSPVDYVVFHGLSDGEIREVAFVEVKVGQLPITPFQRQVKQAIDECRVRWRIVQLADPTQAT